jgi:hypothetical protein
VGVLCALDHDHDAPLAPIVERSLMSAFREDVQPRS